MVRALTHDQQHVLCIAPKATEGLAHLLVISLAHERARRKADAAVEEPGPFDRVEAHAPRRFWLNVWADRPAVGRELVHHVQPF